MILIGRLVFFAPVMVGKERPLPSEAVPRRPLSSLIHMKRTCGESPRTTKLYDRTSDAISLDEIERILI
jgi:hypothetical protein